MSDQIQYLSEPKPFEEKYLKVREKEGRVLSDDQARLLPDYQGASLLVSEWQMRQKTFTRFLAYLKKNSFSSTLDIGCGNGWFTKGIHAYTKGSTVGLDVNAEELEQANRIHHTPGLEFCYGDIFQDIFPDRKFDLITLNASIQYFPDLPDLMQVLYALLEQEGEIHILDSPFYPSSGIKAAQQRSKDYYTSVGYPEMADEYYHHSLDTLQQFQPKKLYQPSKLTKFLGRKDSPFSWYRIKH